MMRKLAIGIAGAALLAVISASPAQAAPVACPTNTTMSTLLTFTDGCYSQDKLFTNFNYSSPGANGTDADDVSAALHFVTGGGLPDEHGWSFSDQWSVPTTIGYTISVCNGVAVLPGNCGGASVPGLVMNQVKLQQLGSAGTNASVQWTLAPGGVFNTSVPTTETLTSPLANLTSVVLRSSLVPANGFVQSVESIFYENTNVIPEPTSMLLLGTGLIGLGTRFRRRRQGK